SYIDRLTDDDLSYVLKHLDFTSMLNFRQVCRRWKEIANFTFQTRGQLNLHKLIESRVALPSGFQAQIHKYSRWILLFINKHIKSIQVPMSELQRLTCGHSSWILRM